MNTDLYDTVVKTAHEAASRLTEVGQKINALRYDPSGPIPDYRDVKAAFDEYDRCHKDFDAAMKQLLEFPRG